MLKYLKSLKFAKRDKSEFRASLIVVVIGSFISALLPMHGMFEFYTTLFWVTCMLAGFFCALNAILDFSSMGLIERITNIVWFCLMSGVMLTLLNVALYDMIN